MAYYITKLGITVVLVVLISEVAKRSSFIGAVLASVPLTSVLAILWIYVETGDIGRISDLSVSIVWLVLPSLVLFIALPVLLTNGVNFYLSMALSIGATALSYWLVVVVLGHFGVEL
ncbi:DUF3147 family protein [Salicola sp. Rm-C-2C1-2]|uniref:DUF3147 family protein n=1 Tax=Salicola sp. Rm-C-2C1-2 TaxID=3141321 RepID=UPI0032E36D87